MSISTKCFQWSLYALCSKTTTVETNEGRAESANNNYFDTLLIWEICEKPFTYIDIKSPALGLVLTKIQS